ncbi:TB2/DP1, HVA22 family domain-containing protein [Ceratobasidium sp. AG-Ba]|nr:TB2/DP1, HVA22 family domain-containing protein [Ceratobasidium sp. AG-Ba]
MLVLVVSSYLLFQNVYTTFKALKPPKPSRKSKNGTDPSVKAKQARKRELKGMLACWIVWSCWSSAEAIADRTISVVTPFYNEIKMFLVLFLILGRATMSEAILLHVIRPLVKPYYVSLDSFVQVFTSAADLARAWTTLRKWFSSGSLPRPGGHDVSGSDPDEPLNEPTKPEATSTKEKAEPDPLERFKPKTRGYAQQESEPEDIVYKNPLRDDPPPYGVPRDMQASIERDYPPVFSSRRAPSRSRPDGMPYGRRMSIDQRPAYLGDSSSVTSVSYRGESEVGGPTYGFSPGSEGITNGAGDLAPDTNPDVPSFALSSPEHLPTSVVPAAPAIPSYLQPRTRASRANLNPNRQRKDSYIDGRNPRASAFLEGERGMTFADKPKEAKGLTPDVGGHASPPPMGYGSGSPPTAPSPPAYGNPYADDESDSGSRVDVIQGWRQRSAIPPDPSKQRRAPSAGPGVSSYPYQPASVPYSPQSPPSVAPSFPTPSIAPSLTPSQSVSNVFSRPQPGYRPPSTGPENRAPTAISRPPTNAPSHPPTSTTGMGLPRRQRSTRELRAQVWEPKEDNSVDAERLREEEQRRAIEQKEAERIAALERQRRKVSERTVRGKRDTRDEVVSGEGF